jgi:hypothetical protein
VGYELGADRQAGLGGRLHRHRTASGLDALNNKAANLPATTPFKLLTVRIRPVRAARMAGKVALVTRATPEETEFHHPRQVIHGQLLQRAAMSGAGVVDKEVIFP